MLQASSLAYRDMQNLRQSRNKRYIFVSGLPLFLQNLTERSSRLVLAAFVCIFGYPYLTTKSDLQQEGSTRSQAVCKSLKNTIFTRYRKNKYNNFYGPMLHKRSPSSISIFLSIWEHIAHRQLRTDIWEMAFLPPTPYNTLHSQVCAPKDKHWFIKFLSNEGCFLLVSYCLLLSHSWSEWCFLSTATPFWSSTEIDQFLDKIPSCCSQERHLSTSMQGRDPNAK